MASSTIDWMPSHGRHQINIGPSLGRAIKTRKLKGSPTPTTKRSNLPERDFSAFRYNFKPGSMDTSRPASIEVKKGPENTQIFAEFPSKENEVCTYAGTEIPAKEVDCILIYDEETGQYTLEKLDSFVSLQFGGKRFVVPSAPSPATEPSTPSTNTKGKAKQDDDDDELERLLLADDNNRDSKLVTTTSQRHDEEEEEGEEIEIPLRLQVSKRAAPLTESSPTLKPTPKSKELPLKQPKLAPKPPKKIKPPPSQPEDTTPYADEEVIEIERPPKKPRLSTTSSRQPPAVEPPKPKPPVELSLPGGQSTFVAPPLPPGSITSKKATMTMNTPTIPITVPPGVSANITMEEVLGDEEEEEDDWEAVPTAVAQAPSQHEYDKLEDEIFGQGFGDDEEQEIDINAFEAELNEQMEMQEDAEDDDDMEDVMQEVASAGTNRPISLNRLASGMVEGESDEEYSSSESESN